MKQLLVSLLIIATIGHTQKIRRASVRGVADVGRAPVSGFTLLDHSSGVNAANSSGPATTGSMNCTGASLLAGVIYAGFNDPVTDQTITSNVGGNTFTKSVSSVNGIYFITFFWRISPAVSGSQTVTATPAGASFTSLSAACFSGTVTALDAQSTSGTVVCYPCTLSSITPAAPPGLFLTAVTENGATGVVVDGGYTVIETRPSVGGSAIGGKLAWKQSSTAIAPTWSDSGGTGGTAQQVAFK